MPGRRLVLSVLALQLHWEVEDAEAGSNFCNSPFTSAFQGAYGSARRWHQLGKAKLGFGLADASLARPAKESP